jgi:hypothetical protein
MSTNCTVWLSVHNCEKSGVLETAAYAAIEGSLILRPLIDRTSTAYSLAAKSPVTVTSVTPELALTRTLAVGKLPVGFGLTVTAVTLCNRNDNISDQAADQSNCTAIQQLRDRMSTS